MFNFLKKKKIPTIDLQVETREVKAEVKSFKVEMPPYEPPTDKEILEGLEWAEQYEAAFLIRDLKKQNMVLKGKLTKLMKKANAYKEDLDNANAALKEMIRKKPDGDGWIAGTTKQ